MWAADRGRVVVGRDAAAADGDAAVGDRDAVEVEGDAGVAELADDAAPVRVLAVERALDEQRVGDLAGGPVGLAVGRRAGHPDVDDLRRALGVGGHLAGEGAAGLGDRGGEGARSTGPARPLARRRTVSLVEVQPSTVIELNVGDDRGAEDSLQHRPVRPARRS